MGGPKYQYRSGGKGNIASIDIGSHTARMLIAKRTDTPALFEPLARRRAYTILAEGFNGQPGGIIVREAIERALFALDDFVNAAREYGVEEILAVSTGVARKAGNREYFSGIIRDRTGIDAQIISGEKEAILTQKGVLHSLGLKDGDPVIFDLGGGTTEFICGSGESRGVRSIPLGAVVLTQEFLEGDPPEEKEIDALNEYIDGILRKSLSREIFKGGINGLVGAGGTVTTLAAMLDNIDIEDITPARITGRILKREQLEILFSKLKSMSLSRKLGLTGLDQGRAGVILAGTMVVIRILHFFNALRLTASYSDILEGILISFLKGERDE